MRTIALLVVALLVSGCGRLREEQMTPGASATSAPAVDSVVAGGAEPGFRTVAMHTPDGRDRSYHLFAPSSMDDEPVPLLVAMHGGLGSGLQFRENSEFDELAEEHGFFVVYPEGISIVGERDNRVWNGGACCGPANENRRDVDDVGFIAAVIAEISATYPVDSTRVFATGHSNGAIMSYRLACELADTVVAIAFQSGSIEIDECHPSKPVSVLHLHGLADTAINIDGGPGDGVSRHDFASPVESIETMAERNGCSGSEDLVDESNPDVSGTRWTGCDENVSVQMMLVDGANHVWMGHPITFLQDRIMGEPYPDLDASAVIWEFLAGAGRS